MVTREEIIQFVRDPLGFTPTSTTKFWWDTGCAGLDVIAFWEEFAKHYEVNMESVDDNFDYGDSEGGIGEEVQHVFRRITFRSVPKAKHFTIDHLVDVVSRRKWFDP